MHVAANSRPSPPGSRSAMRALRPACATTAPNAREGAFSNPALSRTSPIALFNSTRRAQSNALEKAVEVERPLHGTGRPVPVVAVQHLLLRTT